MIFDLSVMAESMPIFLMQSSNKHSEHALSSISLGVYLMTSSTCRGIPPRISKRCCHCSFELENNGAIAFNSVSVQIGMKKYSGTGGFLKSFTMSRRGEVDRINVESPTGTPARSDSSLNFASNKHQSVLFQNDSKFSSDSRSLANLKIPPFSS